MTPKDWAELVSLVLMALAGFVLAIFKGVMPYLRGRKANGDELEVRESRFCEAASELRRHEREELSSFKEIRDSLSAMNDRMFETASINKEVLAGLLRLEQSNREWRLEVRGMTREMRGDIARSRHRSTNWLWAIAQKLNVPLVREDEADPTP